MRARISRSVTVSRDLRKSYPVNFLGIRGSRCVIWLNGAALLRRFVGQGSNPCDASIIVRLAKVYRPADLRVHFGPAQTSPPKSLPVPPAPVAGRQEQPGALGHQDVSHITGRYAPPATHMPMMAEVRNAIALITALLRKTRPKSSVRNTSSQRKENPPNQRDKSWDVIVDRDILRANHFLRVIGKMHRPSRCIVGKTMNVRRKRGESGHRPCRGRATHSSYISCAAKIPSSKNACPVDQLRYTLSCRHRPFLCCDSIAFAPPPWRFAPLHS